MCKYLLLVAGVVVSALTPRWYASAENMHSGFDDLSQWRDDSSGGSPKSYATQDGVLRIETRKASRDRVKVTHCRRDFGEGRYSWRVYVPPMGTGDQASIGAFLYRDDKHEVDFEIGYGKAALRAELGCGPGDLVCYCTSQGFPFSSSQLKIRAGRWYTLAIDLTAGKGGDYLVNWHIDRRVVKTLQTGIKSDVKFGIHCSVENLDFLGDHLAKQKNYALFDWMEFDAEHMAAPRYAVCGYLPDYRIRDFDTTLLRYATDIIYFSLEPNGDGTLVTGPFVAEHCKTLAEWRTRHGFRLLVSVGGWGRSRGFAAMSTDDAGRGKFVKTMTDFCVTNSFDGVDYDWEFPKTAQEKKGYIDLIRDTKQAFLPHGKIVTVALGHQQNLGKEAYGLLDRVHIMSYDHLGKHSTLEHAKGDAARFMGFGVLKGKLLLGVPFYARNVKKPDDSRSYGDLAEAHDLEPDSDWVCDYYFNGINTTKSKAAHAQELGLGGIMVWEIGQDSRGDKSLLRALYEARH
jgi:chitinase